ncbi:MAG: hypothetical protein ACLPSW_02915 [Roseiarcus sp.]|jgi:hypothetical protein
MEREAHIRMALARSALQLFPPSIREELIAERKIAHHYGLSVDAVIALGDAGVSFQRSVLFDSIRTRLDTTDAGHAVRDLEGNEWEVLFEERDASQLVLQRGAQRILLPNLQLLSTNSDTRLSVFTRAAMQVNLPGADVERWRNSLARAPLDDEDVRSLTMDLAETPSAVMSSISQEVSQGRASIDVLVPCSARYYERLAGLCVDDMTLEAYRNELLAGHVGKLVAWDAVEGLKWALLLASHASISTLIGAAPISMEIWETVIEWSTHSGDLVSRVAALEIGLAKFESDPSVRDALATLVESVATSCGDDMKERCSLFSSLVMLVYGRIAEMRIFASKPPFWRKLIAVAQASLIERCIHTARCDLKGLCDWANQVGAFTSHAQLLGDMRLEPRAIPEFFTSQQWEQEIYGRVYGAANARLTSVTAAGWAPKLLDDVDGSLRRHVDPLRAFLPGPLEGNIRSPLEIPSLQRSELESQLLVRPLSLDPFRALCNAALLFYIPKDFADKAAEALADDVYQLRWPDDEGESHALLAGLAIAAAVSRSTRLAEAVFILLRINRRFRPSDLNVRESFRISAMACAAYEDSEQWYKQIGSVLGEIAYAQISNDDAQWLLDITHQFCHLYPDLWATCGRPEAALRAVLRY